jgi:SAM-dependent methyltransferase
VPGKERALSKQLLKLYNELAPWWHLFSAPEHYEEEVDFFLPIFQEHSQRPIQTMLELGSGGGNNASYLKTHFQMTLVDLSPSMLAASRNLNPECEHVEGDMRTVRLEREFDAVFVHDAVMYMLTEADLAQAVHTAALHLAPGGVVLFAPDHVQETFEPSTDHGGEDDGQRGVRYLEWTWSDGRQERCLTDFAIMLREKDGSVRTVHDRHEFGLFPRQTWLDLLAEEGLAVGNVVDKFERDLFWGVKLYT